MLLSAALAGLALLQGPTEPRFEFKEQPVNAGPLEMIYGLEERAERQFTLKYLKENETVVGQVNTLGNDLVAATLGFTRYSIKLTTLAGKPCRLLHSVAFATRAIRNEAKGGITQETMWWVDADQRILRQYVKYTNEIGAEEADAAYRPDRIDVTHRLYNGKTTRRTMVPANMDLVQAQFRPMFVDGELKESEKRFLLLDPLLGTFHAYTLKAGNRISNPKREGALGRSFELEGPSVRMRVLVDHDRKLLRIELPRNRTLQ